MKKAFFQENHLHWKKCKGHVECNFRNPVGKISTKEGKFFAHCPNLKKYFYNLFFINKIYKEFLWTRRMRFWQLCRTFWQKDKTFWLNVGDGFRKFQIKFLRPKMFVLTRERIFQRLNQKILPEGWIIASHYPNMVKYIQLFRKVVFPKNIPLDRLNAVLTTLPKFFCQKIQKNFPLIVWIW